MTGSEQPLDRFVFGPMKKIAIRLWGEAMAQNNDISYTRSSAAKIMVQSWNGKISFLIKSKKFYY